MATTTTTTEYKAYTDAAAANAKAFEAFVASLPEATEAELAACVKARRLELPMPEKFQAEGGFRLSKEQRLLAVAVEYTDETGTPRKESLTFKDAKKARERALNEATTRAKFEAGLKDFDLVSWKVKRSTKFETVRPTYRKAL